MRYLTTSEAARLLQTTPGALRNWERRFGFPTPCRSPGNHRMFVHSEVSALVVALRESSSIASAVSRARQGLAAHNNALVGALDSYDREQADIEIETTLGLLSVERSVDEVLLPALAQVAGKHTVDSAAWAFAAHWGGDWLRRATRMVMPPVRDVSILLGDASRDELDPDAAHIRAFELFCVRAGATVLTLSVRGGAGISDVLAVSCPDMVVLAGGRPSDTAGTDWTNCVRRAAFSMPIVTYRHAELRDRLRGSDPSMLPSRATDAHHRLIELVEATQLGRVEARRRSRAAREVRVDAQMRAAG
jgi:MerR family transcriptional regulator, light-induced transcriptional regulator